MKISHTMITLKRKSLVVFVILGAVFSVLIHAQATSAFAAEDENSMSSMMGMCSATMNKAPKDVTIKTTSSQVVQAGKEAKITILVTNKTNKKPILDADVPIMIERGSSMSSMEMVGQMFSAEEMGKGKYTVKFTPDKKGIYTIHTHVIPSGKSMMSMMQNHMDIGIIAK
jgi:hypothetical protein